MIQGMLSQTPRPPYHWLKWGRLRQGPAGWYQTRIPWMNLGKPAPQITADFQKAPLSKHSSPVKTTRLTQESTTDVEFPEKPQKDDSDSEQYTSSESSTEEEAEIEPVGSMHGEKIQHSKCRADACRLDTHLKSFQVGLGDQDKAMWAKQETMKCGMKYKDPLGAPLEYIQPRKVFEPLASSAYGLCRFYDVGLKATKGSAPISCLMPKAPMTSSLLKALLHKGRRQGCPLLIMAITGEVTPHGLLSKLHMPGALQCMPMKCEDDPADQPRMKISFCPFCSYHCHNDSTFLNHIVSFHYHMGYSCGKCVEEVFITSQSFKVHFKECDGLSCDSTDAGRRPCCSPRRQAKDESPCKRQEQPSKKTSAKDNEHAPAGASKHRKKKAQKK